MLDTLTDVDNDIQCICKLEFGFIILFYEKDKINPHFVNFLPAIRETKAKKIRLQKTLLFRKS